MRLAFLSSLLSLTLTASCAAQIQVIDPPIPNKEVQLDLGKIDLYLGYSTRESVIAGLGTPSTTENSASGGEDFYWKDLVEDYYARPDLTLIYSRKINRLIQIIYHPKVGEKFLGIFNTNQDTSVQELKDVFQEKRKSFDVVGNTTIWLAYYESTSPIFNITCGYQFKNGILYAINYMIDGEWFLEK